MPCESMQLDKKEVNTATFYSTIPFGSGYSTCKTVVSCNTTNNIEEDKKRALQYTSQSSTMSREKPIGSVLDASNLQYCELSNVPHRYHCLSTSSLSLIPFAKVRRAYSSTLATSKSSPREVFEFSTSKISFLFMCLMIAILFLCAEGSPVSKIDSLKSSSLLVEKRNDTLTDFQVQDTEIVPQQTKDSSTAEMAPDSFSVKIKRSLGKPKRPRKGGKRKGSKRKHPRQKQPNKKNRRRKPNHKTNPLPVNVLPQKPNHHDVSASPRRQRLYNKIGQSFHLVVGKDGSVRGESSHIRSDYSELEIKAVGKGGIVAIMGVKAKKYICVTKRGSVKARKKYKKARCQFTERILSNKQNTYESLSCTGCYLNINKRGKVRKLKRANHKLPQTHFLPLRIKQSSTSENPNYLSAKKGKIVTVDLKNLDGTNHVTEERASSEPNGDEFRNDDVKLKFDITDPKRDVIKASGRPSKSLNHRRKSQKQRKNRKNMNKKKRFDQKLE